MGSGLMGLASVSNLKASTCVWGLSGILGADGVTLARLHGRVPGLGCWFDAHLGLHVHKSTYTGGLERQKLYNIIVLVRVRIYSSWPRNTDR